MAYVWICTIVIHMIHGLSSGATLSDEFNSLLKNLANDGLGVQQMQNYLDNNAKYKSVDFSGSSLIQEISTGISQKFDTGETIVRNLKQKYEASYNDMRTSSDFFDCCNPPSHITFTYDEGMKGHINKDTMCYVGVGSKKSTTKHLHGDILAVMRYNFIRQEMAKWMYIATEEGILYIYPASKNCLFDSNTFDPRFRSWYVETATPKPKNIVVVIDNSGSMDTRASGTNSLMHIAREAAKTVVDTFNPNDAVGVVKFSTYASVPSVYGVPACYSETLAQGTPRNKKNIRTLIDSIRSSGSTYYGKGLKKAFDLLGKDERTANGERGGVVLFLTDGVPTDHATVLQDIKDYNKDLNNSVVLLTFGIGDAANNAPILRDMARVTGYTDTNGVYKTGTFTSIPNANDLRSAMGSYYNFFPRSTDGLTIAVPYFDGFGLGLITSLCTPLVTSQTLRGVACADISLSELLDEATFFRPSELSYAFIVDNFGRLMSHPLLPKLSEYAAQPLFVDMLQIEKSSGAKDILSSMLRGESGKKSMTSLQVLSRGDNIHDGVVSESVSADYFWSTIKNTNYSVCVALRSADKGIEYSAIQPVPSFLYHRLDLLVHNYGINACNHVNQLGKIDKTSIKFTPYAFNNPSSYLDNKEYISHVKKYEMIMTGKDLDVSVFKVGIKEVVSLTAAADLIWLSPTNIASTKDFFVWKYLGTTHGVFREFPASPLYKQFDHTSRPWYRKAVSNRGQIIVTPPYKDAGGSGTILTLATTLYEGSTNIHTVNDPVFGVMGLDFSMRHFQTLLHKKFTDCDPTVVRCFVMDNSGYLVYHPEFMHEGATVEHVHIMEKVEIVSSSSFVKVDSRSLNFELHDIRGSNLFLGKSTNPGYNSLCSCDQTSSRKCKESKVSLTSCECPCQLLTDFSFCLNSFPVSSDNYPLCVPDSPPVTDTATLGNAIAKDLAFCFDYKCAEKTSESDCGLVVGCSWCNQFDYVDNPVCRNIGKCPNNAPFDGDGGGLGSGAVAGIVVAVIIIIVVVAGACVWKRKSCTSNRSNTAPYATSAPPDGLITSYPSSDFPSRSTDARPPPTAPPVAGTTPHEPNNAQNYSNKMHHASFNNQAFQMPPEGLSYPQPPPPYTPY